MTRVWSPDGRLAPPRPALLVGAGALVLATVACLVPPSVFDAVDWLQLHRPNRLYLARALGEGRLPLWNPHVALGRPFAADIETGSFYPPSLLLLGLDPAAALFVLVVVHYALGLLGMLVLGRTLGLARWATWLAAGSFLWSAPIVARLAAGQAPYALAICYLPLVFALAARLQDRPSFRGMAALAVALAFQLLCGHPQIAWITWLGLAAFVLGRAVSPGAPPPAFRLRALLVLAAAGGAALALSGPMLLPFLELVTQGNRSAPTLAFASAGSMEWWQWTSLLWPDGGRMIFHWAQNLYGGLLPAVLGVAGLAWWRDRNLRGFLAAGLVGAVLAAGSHTPLFPALYALLPGVSAFRLHSRAGVLVLFALTVSGAFFLSRAKASRLTIGLLAAGATVAALGPVLFQTAAPGGTAGDALVARPLLALATAVAAGAAVLARRTATVAAARVALAVLVIGELGWSIGPERRAWAQPTARQGEPVLFRLLVRNGLYLENGVPPRVAVPPWLVRENAAMSFGWAHVAGYNALALDRVWVYLHEALGIEPPALGNTYPSDLIYERGPFPYDSASISVGWEPRQGLALRRDPDPRAYVVTAARRVRDWHEAVSAMASGHPFHRIALVETETRLPGQPVADSTRADIVSFAPEHVVVRTDSVAAGLLVLAEAWYPGWTATVDGAPAPCRPANAWMRAVPVPAGAHTVELRFHSRWLGPGALLCLVTAVLLAGGAVLPSLRPGGREG